MSLRIIVPQPVSSQCSELDQAYNMRDHIIENNIVTGVKYEPSVEQQSARQFALALERFAERYIIRR